MESKIKSTLETELAFEMLKLGRMNSLSEQVRIQAKIKEIKKMISDIEKEQDNLATLKIDKLMGRQ